MHCIVANRGEAKEEYCIATAFSAALTCTRDGNDVLSNYGKVRLVHHVEFSVWAADYKATLWEHEVLKFQINRPFER